MIVTDLDEAVYQALSGVTEERIFAIGAQAAVIVDGKLMVDAATGSTGGGKPSEVDDLHNVYCLLKPLSYLLLAHVLESAGCGPDDLLDEVVELPKWCPDGLTLRRLASHEAGLADPRPMVWRGTPPERRAALLEESRNDRGPAYSELAGGLVAEHIIDMMTDLPADKYCVDMLLSPLGLCDDIIVDAEFARSASDRIQAPVLGLPVLALPMLSELLPSNIGEIRLALGALATMRGVAGFFNAIGRVMGGIAQPGLPSPGLIQELLDDDRPLSLDPTLERPAKWAGGLMVDLHKQGISRFVGTGSVGHTGGLANSVALYDPTRRASVAIYLNGVGASLEDQILPRQYITDQILGAIAPNE